MSQVGGSIIVSRPRSAYRDVFRAYRILVDGVDRGQVSRGDRLVVPVIAGPHAVRASIDWTGSKAVEVDVPAGGAVRLQACPRAPWRLHDLLSRTRWVLLTTEANAEGA